MKKLEPFEAHLREELAEPGEGDGEEYGEEYYDEEDE